MKIRHKNKITFDETVLLDNTLWTGRIYEGKIIHAYLWRGKKLIYQSTGTFAKAYVLNFMQKKEDLLEQVEEIDKWLGVREIAERTVAMKSNDTHISITAVLRDITDNHTNITIAGLNHYWETNYEDIRSEQIRIRFEHSKERQQPNIINNHHSHTL